MDKLLIIMRKKRKTVFGRRAKRIPSQTPEKEQVQDTPQHRTVRPGKVIKWRLSEPWNMAAMSENRPLVPREYIYASEIFGSKIDRFLKMRAVPFTDPPNDRSLRKFFSGNVWEHIVKQVLLVTGLYHKEEVKIDATPFSGLMSVHGRHDFLAGGYVERDEALYNIKKHNLPEILHRIAYRAIDFYAGQNLEMKIIELKSISMFTYEYIEKRNRAIDGHVGQSYHYKRNSSYPTEIAYVSKDTTLLKEYETPDIEDAYKQDIAQMTYYLTRGIQPDPEPLMGFDASIGAFNKNFKVEYSPYLKMIYGFGSPDEYRRAVEALVKRWNNALSRYAKAELGHMTPTGKPIVVTAKNKEVRQEIINSGYDFQEVLKYKMQNLGDDVEEFD